MTSTDQLIVLYDSGLSQCASSLRSVADRDWSVPAGTLEWTCWQTVDHVTDCIFSYALQIAGRVRGGFLRLEQLHALPDAGPAELLDSLDAVGRMFAAVVEQAPPATISSDGYFDLSLSEWVARALNEMLLHTYDVMSGLGEGFTPQRDLCGFVLQTPALWMYDGVDREAADPWHVMRTTSERSV
jgi:uncharacterized protein (TIGR03083 family)